MALTKKNNFFDTIEEKKFILCMQNFIKCSLTFQNVLATAVKEGDFIGVFYQSSLANGIVSYEDWTIKASTFPVSDSFKQLTCTIHRYAQDNNNLKLSECNYRKKAPALSITII